MIGKVLKPGAIWLAVFFVSDAAHAQAVPPETVQKYIDGMFAKAKQEWKLRVQQDETQRTCSTYRNDPPPAESQKILEREKATVTFPEGELLGDWKAGEKVAQSGQGGQFTDNEKTVRGGNCYACHQLAPSEVSYGTLGPSLLGYGKIHNFSKDDAKATYARIFNAQSVVPCSQMPRFGYHKFLSVKQMKDVLAYLFDPASPVNK